jgi:hypothetical protein
MNLLFWFPSTKKVYQAELTGGEDVESVVVIGEGHIVVEELFDKKNIIGPCVRLT